MTIFAPDLHLVCDENYIALVCTHGESRYDRIFVKMVGRNWKSSNLDGKMIKRKSLSANNSKGHNPELKIALKTRNGEERERERSFCSKSFQFNSKKEKIEVENSEIALEKKEVILSQKKKL